MRVELNQLGRVSIYLIIITTFFRGFIRNFFGIGTILVDLMFALCLMLTVYVGMRKKLYFSRTQLVYFFWVCLCIFIFLLQYMLNKTTSLYRCLLGIRNDVIYTSLFICACVLLKTKDLKQLYNFIENTGVFLCVFAIIQYFGRNILPSILLDASDAETYWYYEANAIRVNGLIGNTIAFGAFTVIIAAIVWADLLSVKYKSPILWIKLIICASACTLTFGRACFVGFWIAIIVEWVFYGGPKNAWENIKRYFRFIVLAVIIALLMFVGFKDSIVISRILDRNSVMNVGSDIGHVRAINNAIDVISQNFLLGYGLDKAGSSGIQKYFIIGDGTIWEWLLKWGIFPIIVFAVLVIFTIVRAIKICSNETSIKKKVALVYLGINAYMLPAAVFNSVYSVRICLVLNWLFAGIMYIDSGQEY